MKGSNNNGLIMRTQISNRHRTNLKNKQKARLCETDRIRYNLKIRTLWDPLPTKARAQHLSVD